MAADNRGYRCIDKADREALRNELAKRKECHEIARSIGRPSASLLSMAAPSRNMLGASSKWR